MQDASLGVLMGQSLLCFSSTFTESVMMWIVGWTSRDTRHALTMYGASLFPELPHVTHISLSCLQPCCRCLRLNSPAQPTTIHISLSCLQPCCRCLRLNSPTQPTTIHISLSCLQPCYRCLRLNSPPPPQQQL